MSDLTLMKSHKRMKQYKESQKGRKGTANHRKRVVGDQTIHPTRAVKKRKEKR
ncbi:MAG: hypothetical protein ACXWYM_00065 [Candidatus Binatia bacterium]